MPRSARARSRARGSGSPSCLRALASPCAFGAESAAQPREQPGGRRTAAQPLLSSRSSSFSPRSCEFRTRTDLYKEVSKPKRRRTLKDIRRKRTKAAASRCCVKTCPGRRKDRASRNAAVAPPAGEPRRRFPRQRLFLPLPPPAAERGSRLLPDRRCSRWARGSARRPRGPAVRLGAGGLRPAWMEPRSGGPGGGAADITARQEGGRAAAAANGADLSVPARGAAGWGRGLRDGGTAGCKSCAGRTPTPLGRALPAARQGEAALCEGAAGAARTAPLQQQRAVCAGEIPAQDVKASPISLLVSPSLSACRVGCTNKTVFFFCFAFFCLSYLLSNAACKVQ